jgi:ACS family D-galactonate transporter-like MFS transporter
VPSDVLSQSIPALGGGPQALQQLQTVAQASTDPQAGPKLQFVVTHGPAVQAALADPQAAPKIAFVQAHGPDVLAAQGNAPGEWQHWLWICIAGEVVFIPMSLVLVGRWSPRKAKADEQEHAQAVAKEMAALGLHAS